MAVAGTEPTKWHWAVFASQMLERFGLKTSDKAVGAERGVAVQCVQRRQLGSPYVFLNVDGGASRSATLWQTRRPPNGHA